MVASSSPSTSASSSSKLPQRRLASQELDFFTPAATSFRPRPYTPHSLPSLPPLTSSTTSSTLRNHPKSLDMHSIPPAGMDPLPTDPNVVFIHPPFTTFPNSELFPDGLSYHLLAENPEWFLDADDFISQNNNSINAIPYPPHLEPPRGWCPAKKKDLKDRGSDGWPEGEEPRLRCTFCRRTYAGVNAKSMWRRHVFEKHKIAMANRRDNNERPRGRGANKENRQLLSNNQLESHDRLVKLDVAPQPEFCGASHKSKFRSLLPAAEEFKRRKINNQTPTPSAPKVEQSEFLASQDEKEKESHPLSHSHIPPLSPPLTPPLSSNPANVSPNSNFSAAPSLPPALPTIPPSPYDPLLTPSFRHSPPRLPSDQPWRFPSPSHPLHSRSRELSLSMLIRDLNSPIVKGSPAQSASPSFVRASPIPSPRASNFINPKRVLLELDTPESLEKLSRPSPRALFSRGGHSSTNRTARYRIQESPLQRNSTSLIRRHKHSNSELSDDWLSDASLNSTAAAMGSTELLPTVDPFNIMYSPWGPVNDAVHSDPEHHKTMATSTGADSPVLRNGALPSGVGLGIGLLGPFTLSGDDARQDVDDSDFDGILLKLSDEEVDTTGFLDARDTDVADNCEKTPPLKKRRVTVED